MVWTAAASVRSRGPTWLPVPGRVRLDWPQRPRASGSLWHGQRLPGLPLLLVGVSSLLRFLSSSRSCLWHHTPTSARSLLMLLMRARRHRHHVSGSSTMSFQPLPVLRLPLPLSLAGLICRRAVGPLPGGFARPARLRLLYCLRPRRAFCVLCTSPSPSRLQLLRFQFHIIAAVSSACRRASAS